MGELLSLGVGKLTVIDAKEMDVVTMRLWSIWSGTPVQETHTHTHTRSN